MIYISLSETEKDHRSQHETAHRLLTSLLTQLGYNDPLILKKDNGRPFVKYENTDISISHSKNLVAVCVATDKDLQTDSTIELPIEAKMIGIDIEYLDKKTNLDKRNRLAKRFLSREASSVEEFFCMWTKNEAVGKMTGEGVIQSHCIDCDVLSLTVILENYDEEYSMSIAYSV